MKKCHLPPARVTIGALCLILLYMPISICGFQVTRSMLVPSSVSSSWSRYDVAEDHENGFKRKRSVTVSLAAAAVGIKDDDLEEPKQVYAVPSMLDPLLDSAQQTTLPRNADTTAMGHDPFRYEWGTWVDEDRMRTLMDRMDEIRVNAGAYDRLLNITENTDETHDENDQDESNLQDALRLKVAGGKDWDCILHVLPQDTEWKGRWPTGSWSIVKALQGLAEICMLRGPDRSGMYKKATSKKLRGGGDGSLGGGASTAGQDCLKYVGGPIRSYRGNKGNESTTQDDEQETNDDGKKQSLNSAMGMKFDKVGGLDKQLESIARRVLASRANPAAARRLGVSHVKGILLSGPPGCGKTLLARELSDILGAREPQIVNGPEILDKYIGEAEKKVRELFAPAEQEYAQVGDDSALHIIILDEMDAIARKRGTATADTTGVRDSVVNQLLAKMDGVKEASNVLVVGLTNRPELLDPALLRPGRLEVHLRVELPDLLGRRDILRIHTRRMRQAGAMSKDACDLVEDVSEKGLAGRSEYFSGAELAGLVRSAASFALARTVEEDVNQEEVGVVSVDDLNQALKEVRPALGKQDEVLKLRFPSGISPCNSSMERILRDLKRFTSPPPISTISSPRLQSLLLVGAGGNGGAGATALAAWAAAGASSSGTADYVRFITALDLLSGEKGGGEEARAAALVERFSEAREMSNSILVLDDVDQLCAGSGPNGYSNIMLATLRALLRT
eukprot:scaffold143509_cov51-Attheya_sp.AAC.1